MSDRGELTWRTSTKSSGGACVEIAADADHVYVRHSKDREGPTLTFDHEAFADFIAFIKDDGFDRQ